MFSPVPSRVFHNYSSSSSRLSSFHYTFHSLCSFTTEISIQPCVFTHCRSSFARAKHQIWGCGLAFLFWWVFVNFFVFIVLCQVSIVKYFFPAVNCNRFIESTSMSLMKIILCCYTNCSLLCWFWLGQLNFFIVAGVVFCICDRNSADNTGMSQLSLSRASREARPFLLLRKAPAPPQQRKVRVHRESGRDMARRPDPDWPQGYSISDGVVPSI